MRCPICKTNLKDEEVYVCDNCKRLPQQLAEKDKEIEEYNNYFKSFGCKDFVEFQELIALAKISANDKERDNTIRKQVCDEIEQWIEGNCRWDEFGHIKDLYWHELKDALVQIEKGEE